jgi:hypothetical protein
LHSSIAKKQKKRKKNEVEKLELNGHFFEYSAGMARKTLFFTPPACRLSFQLSTFLEFRAHCPFFQYGINDVSVDTMNAVP